MNILPLFRSSPHSKVLLILPSHSLLPNNALEGEYCEVYSAIKADQRNLSFRQYLREVEIKVGIMHEAEMRKRIAMPYIIRGMGKLFEAETPRAVKSKTKNLLRLITDKEIYKESYLLNLIWNRRHLTSLLSTLRKYPDGGNNRALSTSANKVDDEHMPVKDVLNIIGPMPRKSDKILAENVDVFALEEESPGQCGINKFATDAAEEKPVNL
ncbi:hypothetical protein ACTXT7_013572 [Hymenolepis weldensis]